MQEAYNLPGSSRYPDAGDGAENDGGNPVPRDPPPVAFLFTAETLGDAYSAFDGVREMLAALSAASYALAVAVKGERSRAWAAALPAGAIQVPVSVSPGASGAGLGEALATAAERLVIAPGRIVLVGTVEDIGAGRAAGMRVAVALWMGAMVPSTRGALLPRSSPADWVLERPADLTRACARWC